jgi:Flp pilus assembly protein TadG
VRLRAEDGSATTELVLVTPLLIILLLFATLAGRLALSRSDVQGAARDAARAASIERSPTAARLAAVDAAKDNLERSGTSCGDLRVEPDLTDFQPGGSVQVKVTCQVPLGDLMLLRLPASSKEVAATAVEVIDLYREAPPS